MSDNPTKVYNDYIRANLPIGMEYNTGVDRYQVNNHSFFKYKNSNWYYKYVSKFGYSAASVYFVNGFEPALVLDFTEDYFRTAGTDTTFDSAITHAATTNATMVDSDGLLKWRPHNLAYPSEGHTGGNISASATVTAGQVPPAGIADAAKLDFTIFQFYGHFTNLSAGGRYTIACWLRADTAGTISFRNNSNGDVYQDNVPITTEWVRYEAQGPVITGSSGALGVQSLSGDLTTVYVAGFQIHRSDLGGMVNNPDRGDSYVPTTTVARYLPRRGHHVYNGTSWVNEGLLHESDARTNLVTYSEQFDNAAWFKLNSSSLLPNTDVAPDGTTTADELNVVLSTSFVGQDFLGIGVLDRTFSVWVKSPAVGAATAVRLTSNDRISWNTGLSAKVVLTTEWQRVSLSGTLSTGADTRVVIGGQDETGTGDTDCIGKVLIWGAQLEAGSTPSSYIPTAGATATRAAETLTVPAANMPWPTPVVIGEELVTGLYSDLSIFTSTTGSVVYDAASGGVTLTEIAGVDAFAFIGSGTTGITVVAGSLYKVSVENFDGTDVISVTLDRDSGGADIGSFIVPATIGVTDYYFVAPTTNLNLKLFAGGGDNNGTTIGNISVKEINPLSVSIQMDGLMTYADTDLNPEAMLLDWTAGGVGYIRYQLQTSFGTGRMQFAQANGGVLDSVVTGNNDFAPSINVPFNIASRHGSTFVNGAVDGTALTANLTPTALPYLQATNFSLAPTYMGTIGKLRVWSDDIGDTGIEEASAPTFTTEFAMVVTTTTANETFTIPCQDVGTFDAGIEWGDGSVSSISAYNDAGLTHTYATAGDHLIRIHGTFPNIYFNNVGDKLKVKSVENLGDVGWQSFGSAFYGCSSMTSFTVGNTDISSVTIMTNMFRACSSLTSLDVSGFDTSSVTVIRNMFRDCSSLTDVVGVEGFDIEGLNTINSLTNFMTNVTLPTSRYDALLINWDAQEPFDSMSPDFGNSKYTAGSAAATARANLISNDGWTITDGGTA